MRFNPVYRKARLFFGEQPGLKTILRHRLAQEVMKHPWATAAIAVFGAVGLFIQPTVIWTVLVIVVVAFLLYEQELKAAIGAVMVGVFAPAVALLAKALSAIFPGLLVMTVFLYFLYWKSKKPKITLSDEAKAQLSRLRR